MTGPGEGGHPDTPESEETDTSLSPAELLPAEIRRQTQLDKLVKTIATMADLEGRRIGVQEERNKVVMRALEVSENTDKREFEFHSKRLESEERGRDKSYSLARLVVIYGGSAAVSLVAFVVGMAFFGSEDQSAIALRMIGEGSKAAGGAGFLYLVWAAVRRLVRN